MTQDTLWSTGSWGFETQAVLVRCRCIQGECSFKRNLECSRRENHDATKAEMELEILWADGLK